MLPYQGEVASDGVFKPFEVVVEFLIAGKTYLVPDLGCRCEINLITFLFNP